MELVEIEMYFEQLERIPYRIVGVIFGGGWDRWTSTLIKYVRRHNNNDISYYLLLAFEA